MGALLSAFFPLHDPNAPKGGWEPREWGSRSLSESTVPKLAPGFPHKRAGMLGWSSWAGLVCGRSMWRPPSRPIHPLSLAALPSRRCLDGCNSQAPCRLACALGGRSATWAAPPGAQLPPGSRKQCSLPSYFGGKASRSRPPLGTSASLSLA